jgi:hypothetical protein
MSRDNYQHTRSLSDVSDLNKPIITSNIPRRVWILQSFNNIIPVIFISKTQLLNYINFLDS